MISYIGGKNRISKFIVPFYPTNIETYLECFGGMMWCLFRMDLDKFTNLKTIVYNDINPLNVNLFKCVKNCDRFYEETLKYPIQKFGMIDEDPTPYIELFNHCQKDVFETNFTVSSEPNYEIGAKYLYCLTHIFSGAKPETSKYIFYKGKYNDKFGILQRRLKENKWRQYFNKIDIIENMDFCDVIKKYDNETTLIYIDAPYFNCEKYYSNHDFGKDDHYRLSQCVESIKSKFVMSYYHFPELDEWYPKSKYHWESKDFFKSAAASKGKKQNIGTELLIMNY